MSFVTEIVRHSSFAPFTIPHAAAEDTEIDGYLIPKDVPILVNIMSLNMEPKVWKDPETFRYNNI